MKYTKIKKVLLNLVIIFSIFSSYSLINTANAVKYSKAELQLHRGEHGMFREVNSAEEFLYWANIADVKIKLTADIDLSFLNVHKGFPLYVFCADGVLDFNGYTVFVPSEVPSDELYKDMYDSDGISHSPGALFEKVGVLYGTLVNTRIQAKKTYLDRVMGKLQAVKKHIWKGLEESA